MFGIALYKIDDTCICHAIFVIAKLDLV